MIEIIRRAIGGMMETDHWRRRDAGRATRPETENIPPSQRPERFQAKQQEFGIWEDDKPEFPHRAWMGLWWSFILTAAAFFAIWIVS